MKIKTVLVTGMLVAAGLGASAFAAKDDKVDLCHSNGNGPVHVISVSGNAIAAHLAHGDTVLAPGGSCGEVFPPR